MKTTLRLLFLTLFIVPFAAPLAAELTPGTPAPEFPSNAIWLGTDGHSISMKSMRGKVVIVDFWEYTCINCIRTFPHLKQWYRRYHDLGLDIIGVHKGEFAFASRAANVRRAYLRFKLPYPSIADVNDQVWMDYDCNTWPDTFLIDGKGIIRYVHQGEGEYGGFEHEIQKLLEEGHPELDLSRFSIPPDHPLFGPQCGEESQETYIGYARGSLWGGEIANPQGFHPDEVVDYKSTSKRVTRGFFVEGEWRNEADDFEAVVASTPANPVKLGIDYKGRDVYAVLNRGASHPVTVTVLRDGKPIPKAMRGKDIRVDKDGKTYIEIDAPRMYYVVTKEDAGKHELVFEPRSAGVRICSFTFGNRCLENFDRL